MLRTVEEAMSHVIDWWGELPPPMEEAIEQFRTQLGATIDFRRICQKGTRQTSTRKRPWGRPCLMIAALHETGYGPILSKKVFYRNWLCH
jgi:hypothetical protein